MDGAARFNQRDSLATILITAINIVAGFLIGVFQQGIPFQEALKTYTILTVGDGLVTMIPSLLVSVAGGIVITRASSENSLTISATAYRQEAPTVARRRRSCGVGPDPRYPKISFILIAGLMVVLARAAKDLPATDKDATPGTAAAKADELEAAPAIDPMDAALKLDDLTLEVGWAT